jgi:hypothetical protein
LAQIAPPIVLSAVVTPNAAIAAAAADLRGARAS